MAYIQRAISGILKNRVKTSKCTLVVGARQVGKSTLLKHEFSEYNRINFDDKLVRMQAREESKLFFLNNPCPLIIDEVQKRVSESLAGNMFETFVISEILKSYINEGKDYRFNVFYYRGKDKSASGVG